MSPPPFGRGRRAGRDLRSTVVRGEHVQLDLLLRRTSARGWGPWTDAVLILGPLPDSPVSWHVADPVAVGLPVTRGPVSADFTDIERVHLFDAKTGENLQNPTGTTGEVPAVSAS